MASDHTTNEPDTYSKSLKALFGSEKYSDLTIKCGDQDWKVHKAIVCRFSPVIEATVDGAWAEAQCNTIVHTAYDAATVEMLLEYIYSHMYHARGTYTVTSEQHNASEPPANAMDHIPVDNTPSDIPLQETNKVHSPVCSATKFDHNVIHRDLIEHILVYGIADYYRVEPLQQLAARRFAERLNCEEHVEDKLAGLFCVVEALCDASYAEDVALKDPLECFIVKHMSVLSKQGDFMEGLASGAIAQQMLAGILDRYISFRDEQDQRSDAIRQVEIAAREDTLQAQMATLEERIKELRLEFFNCDVEKRNLQSALHRYRARKI